MHRVAMSQASQQMRHLHGAPTCVSALPCHHGANATSVVSVSATDVVLLFASMRGDNLGILDRMRSSSPRPSERRKSILEAATRVLSQHGLRGLTHRAVDREAGVPQGTTSYHASTRQALLELVVEQLLTQSDTHIAAAQTLSALADR